MLMPQIYCISVYALYVYLWITFFEGLDFLPPKKNICPLESEISLSLEVFSLEVKELDSFCVHSMCISRLNPASLWPVQGPAHLPLEPAAHAPSRVWNISPCPQLRWWWHVFLQHYGLWLLHPQAAWLLLCIYPNDIDFCFAAILYACSNVIHYYLLRKLDISWASPGHCSLITFHSKNWKIKFPFL